MVALAGALLTLAVAGAAPASAHEGGAVIDIEAQHPTTTGTHYIVRVTWDNDGHPAADATVTATAVGPDGAQLTPVELAPYDEDGRYAGAVEMTEPGSWTVRITSIEPNGTAETTAEVAATTTTESGSSEVTTGDGNQEGFAPADDGTGASEDEGATNTAASSDDSNGMPIIVIVVAAIVAVGGVIAALGVIRRNRPTPGASTAAGGQPGGGPTGGEPGDGEPADSQPAGGEHGDADAAGGQPESAEAASPDPDASAEAPTRGTPAGGAGGS
jgi:hypothetical protein